MGNEYENSVLSGKESLNLEEKVKEMEVKRCLEAEKKRLLSEVEAGTIFRVSAEKATSGPDFFEIDKIGNGCQAEHKPMENIRIKDVHLYPNHGFVGVSLKVKVVDSTALIDAVPVYSNGNDHRPKWPKTARANGKQAKQTARKGKGNAAKMDEVSEFHIPSQKNGNQLKMMYTRKQMEAMRFENIVGQRNLWIDIYTGLAPEVVTEYDGLVCSKNQKNSLQYCDGWRPNVKERLYYQYSCTPSWLPR